MRALSAQRRIAALSVSGAALCALAGCGSQVVKGDPQDKAQPTASFPVKIESATFPKKQNLAKDSSMQIVVLNSGQRRVPNINVTVKCGQGLRGAFLTAPGDARPPRPPAP